MKASIFQFFAGTRFLAGPFFEAPDDGGGSGGHAPPDDAAGGGGDAGAAPAGRGESSLLSLGGEGKGEGGEPKGEDGGESGGQKGGAAQDGPVTKEALAVPEGKEYDAELGESFLGIVNDASLTKAQMSQKLLELYSSTQDKFFQSVAAAQDAELKAFEAATKAWEAQARKDAEYGGDAFEANLAVIGRGRDRLSTPGAVRALEDAGLGSHPEIVRMFYRAGKLLGEDSSLGGGAAAQARGRDRADLMFAESLRGVSLPSAEDF